MGDAGKRGFGEAVQVFSTETPALAGRPFDCATAILSEPGNAANVYDTAGPVDLVGQPVLAMRVTVPKRFRPGREGRVKVRVTNTGDGSTAGLRLKLSRERGLTATPPRRSLAPLVPLRLRRPAPGGGGADPGFEPRSCVRWSPDPFGGSGSLILVSC